MSSQTSKAPVRDPDSIILCIEDLKKAALKKLPSNIAGQSYPLRKTTLYLNYSYRSGDHTRELIRLMLF